LAAILDVTSSLEEAHNLMKERELAPVHASAATGQGTVELNSR